MMEEANRLIKTIKQMEASLDDSTRSSYSQIEDSDLQITFPLNRCLNHLKEKHGSVQKLHRERFEQIRSMFNPILSPCTPLY